MKIRRPKIRMPGLCQATGKICYWDRDKAHEHLHKLKQFNKYRGSSVYRCKACGSLHVGHRDDTRRSDEWS
jgi:rubrerythrin